MNFTSRIHYYWKATRYLDNLNYETRKKELARLEKELAEDKELTKTDKRFINSKIIIPCKEYYKV